MSPSDALNAIPLKKQFVAITNRTMHCLLNEWTWNFRLAGPGFRRGSNCRLSGGGQLIPPTIQSIPLGLSCVENRESYQIEIMPVTFTQAFSYPPGLILSGLQSQAIRSRYCLREAWSFYYHVSSLGRCYRLQWNLKEPLGQELGIQVIHSPQDDRKILQYCQEHQIYCGKKENLRVREQQLESYSRPYETTDVFKGSSYKQSIQPRGAWKYFSKYHE